MRRNNEGDALLLAVLFAIFAGAVFLFVRFYKDTGKEIIQVCLKNLFMLQRDWLEENYTNSYWG